MSMCVGLGEYIIVLWVGVDIRYMGVYMFCVGIYVGVFKGDKKSKLCLPHI